MSWNTLRASMEGVSSVLVNLGPKHRRRRMPPRLVQEISPECDASNSFLVLGDFCDRWTGPDDPEGPALPIDFESTHQTRSDRIVAKTGGRHIKLYCYSTCDRHPGKNVMLVIRKHPESQQGKPALELTSF